MLKYLGSVGAFIRLNDSENKTYKLLEIFSSSAASELLFSASVNNLNGSVRINTASTSLYINGNSASVLPSQQWAHLTFSFDNKLWTYDSNDFLIRFGDSQGGNFNIQNFYYLQDNLSASGIKYIHQDFTGESSQKLVVTDNLVSINVIDKLETNYISTSTGSIYHSLKNQKRFLYDLAVAASYSLNNFISASTMSGDARYIDGYNISNGDRILSFTDNQIYQLTASAQLVPVSSSIGDFVRVTFGQQYGESYFINTASGFKLTPFAKKVNMLLNYTE